MYISLVVLLVIALAAYFLLSRPFFGEKPAGDRLVRIMLLYNFQNGAIQNLSPTPMKPDEVSYWKIIRWFGHSSYLLQVNGINILVDSLSVGAHLKYWKISAEKIKELIWGDACWPFIHLFLKETVQVALDLKAKVLMPIYWGKYTLAMHDWNEPVINFVKAAEKKNLSVTIPQSGDAVLVGLHYPDQQWGI
ncbi:L-ascorbate metabolism protein UlaG (beta-lactamase superfamily) [Pedobacter sp. CG_S7]|uniref:hypothetical protein n=1 Tax=Pedobacter sp. CG_S7 TaxID=3143930 RepID=UPI0033940118